MESLDSSGKIELLAAPTFLTPAGSRVQSQSGLQVPVQTVADNTVTTQYVNATVRVEMRASMVNGSIQLDLQIQKRTPAPQYVEGSDAIQTAEWSTTSLVRSGGTAVLYGLYDTPFGASSRGS